jgi:hypothetical protein
MNHCTNLETTRQAFFSSPLNSGSKLYQRGLNPPEISPIDRLAVGQVIVLRNPKRIRYE